MFDASRAFDEAQRLPARPAEPAPRGAWASIIPAIKGGAAELGAFGAEVLRGASAGAAIALEGDAMAGAILGRDAVRAGADEARRRIAEGTEFQSATGRRLRDYERAQRPDMRTAGEAEQIVYGAVKALTQAIPLAATAGPVAGGALFGGVQGSTTFDDLRREGVEPGTAAAVAGVAGLVGGAGVALPLAGSTLKRTAALYAIGGPGAFVAQQSASRAILERADYAKLAERYDPLDPTGLLVSSLVPLPFAAAGALRNVREARAAGRAAAVEPEVPPAVAAAEQEAVDAAMVQNLTALRDKVDAEPVPQAVPRAAEDVPANVPPDVPSVPVAAADVPAPVAAAVKPAAPAPTPFADAVQAARTALDEWQASGREIGDFAAGRGLPPEVQNLMVGLQEFAGNPQRMGALMRQLQVETQTPGRPLVDAAADAIDRVRAMTPEQLGAVERDAARVTGPRLPDDPVMSAIAQRLAAVESEIGALPVRMDEETGRVYTVADEIAEARRVAEEGTPEALGARDADLIRVAAECAVSFPT